MELIFRIILFCSGVINLLPSLLAVLPTRIQKSYGVAIPDVNYELLLRHRAVLFAMIGGLMIFSALAKKYYEVAAGAGLISMMSFVVLHWLIGKGITPELRTVMRIDAAATIVLLVGLIAFRLLAKKP